MTYKVLIADDEPIIQEGLKNFIDWHELNCEVVSVVDNGLRAKEELESRSVDIVLADIRMPGMDGIELAAFVQTLYPQMKVIILTGFAHFEYAQAAIQYDVIDFIVKTNPLHKVKAAVQKAIQRIMAERAMDQKIIELKNRLAATAGTTSPDPFSETSAHESDGEYHAVVKKIIEYVRAHYAEKITLDLLAEHVHMNSSYLSRLLNKQMGEPFTDYLNRYRIEKAKEMMGDSKYNINEISLAVGFSDPSYFSITFKRYAGLSPRDYRNQLPFGS